MVFFTSKEEQELIFNEAEKHNKMPYEFLKTLVLEQIGKGKHGNGQIQEQTA